VHKAEDQLVLFRTELADQFEQLLHTKMEAEKARNELEQVLSLPLPSQVQHRDEHALRLCIEISRLP
jgi:hypothetical protein